jgi:hypothetical protein
MSVVTSWYRVTMNAFSKKKDDFNSNNGDRLKKNKSMACAKIDQNARPSARS